jgi:hypothetical protein
MDWDAFKGLAWLQAATEESRINDARDRIASQWAWGSDWYSTEDNLATLFSFLSAPEPLYEEDGSPGSGTRSELLNELDQLPDAGEDEAADEDGRATWLTAVANDVYWDQFWVVPQNRYDDPEFSEPYSMYYRYDKLNGVYEWNTDPQNTPEAWISQADADAQVAGQPAEGELAAEGEAATEEEYSEPAWDENWQMLYRVGPGGVYQYAYSDDQQTIRPGSEWLSYDEVMQGTGATTEAPAEEEAATSEAATSEAAAQELSPEEKAAAQELTALVQVRDDLELDGISAADLENFLGELLSQGIRDRVGAASGEEAS